MLVIYNIYVYIYICSRRERKNLIGPILHSPSLPHSSSCRIGRQNWTAFAFGGKTTALCRRLWWFRYARSAAERAKRGGGGGTVNESLSSAQLISSHLILSPTFLWDLICRVFGLYFLHHSLSHENGSWDCEGDLIHVSVRGFTGSAARLPPIAF